MTIMMKVVTLLCLITRIVCKPANTKRVTRSASGVELRDSYVAQRAQGRAARPLCALRPFVILNFIQSARGAQHTFDGPVLIIFLVLDIPPVFSPPPVPTTSIPSGGAQDLPPPPPPPPQQLYGVRLEMWTLGHKRLLDTIAGTMGM